MSSPNLMHPAAMRSAPGALLRKRRLTIPGGC
jgi:hypothetical protein